MNSLLATFRPYGWNDKPFTEEYVRRICRARRPSVKLIEYPLAASPGFYMVCKGRPMIALDPRLRGVRRLYVLLHELGHYFLHVPPHVTGAHFFRLRPDSRQELEAEVFAAVALLPEPHLRRLLSRPSEEWEAGFTAEIVEFRLKVLDTYGI